MTETLPPEVLMPEVLMDDVQIDEAVAFINERVASHVYNGSLEIGRYVLERFFNNDIRLAGSKNPFKPISYRKLCVHPELSVSRTTLTEMVRTAAQSRFFIENGIPEDAILYTNKVSLARLENNEDKLELVRACIEEGLTTRELKRRVQEICNESNNLPIPPGVAVNKFLTRVERWIRGTNMPDGMTNRGVISSLSPSEKEKILDAAGGILEDMSVISNRIRQLVTILIETPAGPEIDPPDSEEA
jgi:hypothetical protein